MRKRNTKICYQTSLKGSSFLQEENRYLFEEGDAASTDSPSSERIEGLCVLIRVGGAMPLVEKW